MQAILRTDFLKGNQDEESGQREHTEDIPGKFQEQVGKSTAGKEQEAKGTQVGRRPEILKRSWGC
jgi:hypothetical protein